MEDPLSRMIMMSRAGLFKTVKTIHRTMKRDGEKRGEGGNWHTAPYGNIGVTEYTHIRHQERPARLWNRWANEKLFTIGKRTWHGA
jgi:hypothetical protein